MKQKVVDFLGREYQTQENEYLRLIGVKALTLKDRGEVFVGKYLGFKDGCVLFKVRSSDKLPHKSSFWTASYLCGNMASYRNWGDLSWAELRKEHQGDYIDVFCAWLSRMKDDPEFYMVGFKGFSDKFLQEKLMPDKPIIAFGPKDPPLEYLIKLEELVSSRLNGLEEQVLNCCMSNESVVWSPMCINKDDDLTQQLIAAFETSRVVAVQGPPGTGKTYRMAQLVTTLLEEKKSILATALTNEALKVLATKEALSGALTSGRINKTSLSTDEQKDVPGLEGNEANVCNPRQGHLSLSTFYIASRWAADVSEEQPFDYVIVDEASQAYLPMLVASLRLGKKVVWIGDQNQLAPIAQTNEDVIQSQRWEPAIRGFDTVCRYIKMPAFVLGDTFRLTARGAEFTSVFYSTPLRSVSSHQPSTVSPSTVLPIGGGPALLELPLKNGEKLPENAIARIEEVLGEIRTVDPKAQVAILAKFRATVQALQKHFAPQEGTESTLKIETVDRIQGMTVDYTIFFIPNTAVGRSLEKEFFNVATSRARYATIIIADKGIVQEDMPEEVRRFFLKLHEGEAATFCPKEVTASGGISVKVVGKIELPEERSPKKLVHAKDAVYVVDTNVFVDYPNVITRLAGAKVVVPTTVIEELDKLKLKAGVAQSQLREAIKNIHTAFKKDYSSMEEVDPTLLPEGVDRSNPDCLILSVALKHKRAGASPVVLTSDINLQSRAQGLRLATCSPKELFRHS